MKTERHDFLVTALKYVKVAMTKITGALLFRPDGKTPTQVQTLLNEAETALEAALDANDDLDVARGEVAEGRTAGHAACVAVYACMKSCFRKNKGQANATRKLPKGDQSLPKTLARMKAIKKRWAKLPEPEAFIVGEITQESFNDTLESLVAKVDHCTDCVATADAAMSDLRDVDQTMEELVSAALAQGRSHYKPGTANRAYIDAIPTEPSTQLPGEINFLTAESHAPGTATLQFESEHATTARVLHKGPGATAFTVVADVLMPGGTGEYNATGLPGGVHEYMVVPVNSRGDGPESAVQSFEVAEEEAA